MPLATVTVTSRLGPPLKIDLPSDGGPGSGSLTGKALLAAIQPAVDVSVGGQQVASWAPAGRPSQSFWPLTVALVAVVGGLAVFGLVTLLRKV